MIPAMDEARGMVERAKAAIQAGQRATATARLEAALRIDPRCYEAHVLLGNLRQDGNALTEAIDCYERAIRLDPANPTAYKSVGHLLLKVERFAEAVPWFERALRLAPDYHLARNALGLALLGLNRLDEAVALFEETLRACPDDAMTLYHLGSALGSRFQYDAAIAALEASLAAAPEVADTHVNLAVVANGARRFELARRHYREAIRLAPDNALAHHAYGMFLLRLGETAEGWEEYRWYERLPGTPRRDFRTPEWNGEPLDGRTLLVYSQQGYGDAMQCFRYLRQIRGGRVLFEVEAPLVRLLRQSGGADAVLEKAPGTPNPIPEVDFDLHLPDLSLPRLLGTTIENIPAEVPYLAADPADVERWRALLGDAPGRRVGLVWAGNPRFRRNRSRSTSLAELSGLARVPGVRWFSLQVGELGLQPERSGAGMSRDAGDKEGGRSALPPLPELRPLEGWPVTDLSGRLSDFAETAAALACLDLVITVDTAVAHLAGALGRSAWILLAHDCDWRWRVEGEASAWYPTARLFRQMRPFDWGEVAERVAAALR